MTEPSSQDSAAAGSTPEGEGPVGLDDRTAGGAPAANQAQSSPPVRGSHPTATDTEPLDGVPVSELNVGAADAQAASHRVAAARPFTPSTSGPAPAQDGTAQRAPGSQGVSPEPVETDRAAAAMAMAPPSRLTPAQAPGDAKGVPVGSGQAAEGTSETAPRVRGARTPVE